MFLEGYTGWFLELSLTFQRKMMNMKWDIIQSAVQGRGHELNGVPCQDKTASMSEGNLHVVALADGAGSAALSHYGAEHVVQLMCQYMHKHFDRLYASSNAAAVRDEIVKMLQHELISLAEEKSCHVRDLASTLLVAVVKGTHYILIHVGDGVIAYRKEGVMKVASMPSNDEYANCTIFTTSSRALRDMRLLKGELGSIEGFALMSDGSAASLFDKVHRTPAAVLGWLMELCTYLPADVVEQGLAECMENDIRTITTDDCSLAILSCRNPKFQGVASLQYSTLCRLIYLPESASTTRHRLRSFLRLLNALEKPMYLANVVSRVHFKLPHLFKKISYLLSCHLVERLPDGRYVSLVRIS